MPSGSLGITVAVALFAATASAQSGQPQLYRYDAKRLINAEVIAQLKAVLDKDVVTLSIRDQNHRYASLDEQAIDKLDKQWRAERKADNKPLIAATLSSPLSAYLTRVQAHSLGQYVEIFVMDNKGLNVGQSNITSDYWQGDEAKWQKTFLAGANTVFIDDAEYDSELGIWKAQANLAIADKESGAAIGAVTFELNLTELRRRQTL